MHRIPAPFRRLSVKYNDFEQVLNLKTNSAFKNNKEEQVRQKTYRWLTEKLGIHPDYITFEVHISDAKGRADIVVRDEKDEVIWLFECKHEGVPLSTDVLRQVERYDDFIHAKFFSITNGLEIESYRFNEKTKSSEPVATPLTMKELKGKFSKAIFEPHPLTFLKWEEIHVTNPIGKHAKEILTSNTKELPLLWQKAMLNLYRALNVTQRNYWEGKMGNSALEIERDHGVQLIRMGNASGWNGAAHMRSLQVNYKNKHYRVGLQLMPWSKSDGSKLSLIVNLATYELAERDSHNALQLDTERCFGIGSRGRMFCWHDRAPSIGNQGSASNADFFDFLKKQDPNWLYTDAAGKTWVDLGSFTTGKWLTFANEDFKVAIFRIIQYAIIRDEFREVMKSNNVK
ncbi:MAG: hypothetical protein C0424_05020 [Sphingobacteriaceae bacterium]|nr:hypothetical protein [Sphingobacteriaceae bacterium]